MKTRKIILLIVLVLSFNTLHAQFFSLFKPSSAAAQMKFERAYKNLQLAHQAYDSSNLVKMKYYLDEVERYNHRLPDLWLLKGEYFKIKGQINYARNIWKEGYRDFGCFECSEKLKTLPPTQKEQIDRLRILLRNDEITRKQFRIQKMEVKNSHNW